MCVYVCVCVCVCMCVCVCVCVWCVCMRACVRVCAFKFCMWELISYLIGTCTKNFSSYQKFTIENSTFIVEHFLGHTYLLTIDRYLLRVLFVSNFHYMHCMC